MVYMGGKVNKQVRYFQINIIGTLSPVAGRGAGSTGTSRRTWHFHLWGKCRVFPRKRFTFPRGSQGYRLHRPFSRHSSFPSPGKVPGISAKTVHFPPQLAGVPAPQTPLAALAVSTLGGKCREFRQKRFTFPRGSQGYRLHRPLWPHSPFPPLGKVPGISAKTVHFPLGRFTFPRGWRLLRRSSRTCFGKCLVYRHSEKEHLLDLGRNGGFVAKSGQSSKSLKRIHLTISAIHLGSVLDIVKVLIKSAFLRNDIFPMAGRATGFTGISGRTCCFLPQNAYENPAVEKTRPSHRFAAGPSL